ncbi:hypothetical protein ACFL1N_12305 [Thermodesulfobacteriota bacterium]
MHYLETAMINIIIIIGAAGITLFSLLLSKAGEKNKLPELVRA